MSDTIRLLKPDWPAPERVHAVVSLRDGGVSNASYASLNLATHVGDVLAAVLVNRQRLREFCQLPSEPIWLNQVHGCDVVDLDALPNGTAQLIDADASISRRRGTVLAILTADCLPIFFTNRQGSVVMLVHAGWRGLAENMIVAAIKKMDQPVEEVLAWVGPGIGPKAFEVGAEVRDYFLAKKTANEAHFYQAQEGKYCADLVAIALWQLQCLGVGWCGASHACTYTQSDDFYSYRRDGQTGRMASLIWLSE